MRWLRLAVASGIEEILKQPLHFRFMDEMGEGLIQWYF